MSTSLCRRQAAITSLCMGSGVAGIRLVIEWLTIGQMKIRRTVDEREREVAFLNAAADSLGAYR